MSDTIKSKELSDFVATPLSRKPWQRPEVIYSHMDRTAAKVNYIGETHANTIDYQTSS